MAVCPVVAKGGGATGTAVSAPVKGVGAEDCRASGPDFDGRSPAISDGGGPWGRATCGVFWIGNRGGGVLSVLGICWGVTCRTGGGTVSEDVAGIGNLRRGGG